MTFKLGVLPRLAAVIVVAGLIPGCSTDAGVAAREEDAPQDPEVVRQQLANDLLISVDFTTVVRTDGTRLMATVTTRNIGQQAIDVMSGGCGWEFRAYATADRTPPAVWGPGPTRCGSILEPLRLAPGASAEWSGMSEKVSDITATNGPGTYYFTVRLLTFEPDLDLAERDAGEVQLTS